MAVYFDWKEELPTGGKNDRFGKFGVGTTKVRFLTQPLVYDRVWDGVTKKAFSAILYDLEAKSAKIYDIPYSVLTQIHANVKDHGVLPDAKEAYGYSVTRTGTGKEDTKYMVIESKKLLPLPDGLTKERIDELNRELLELREGTANKSPKATETTKTQATATADLDF